MSDPIIKVHKLGKRYRIGAKIDPQGRDNFRDVILNTIKAPFRNLRRLRRLTNFGDAAPPSALSPMPYALCSTPDIIWALKDVSFEVNRGEVVGIIGKNGSGKSTLLKILSRITEPTEGYAEFRGRVSSLLEVGTGFHRELTGRENVYLNGTILGMKKWEIDEKFDEIVAFSEIEKFIDTPVKHYSSGMYVRLAFAVAAHLNPDILLVDEVLAVGDADFQKKCLGKMGDIAKGGRTVLFVSHNMGAVRQLCDRGLLLEKGSIKQRGPIEQCICTYLKTDAERYSSIKEHAIILDRVIGLLEITVNGSSKDELHINSKCKRLDIEINGSIDKSMRLNIEARLFDRYDMPLAFFSPGHENGKTNVYPAGAFRLVGSIKLPKMAKGEYYLHLDITYPGVIGLVEIPHAIRLITEGLQTSTGEVFDYSRRKGWIFLSSDLD